MTLPGILAPTPARITQSRTPGSMTEARDLLKNNILLCFSSPGQFMEAPGCHYLICIGRIDWKMERGRPARIKTGASQVVCLAA